MLINDTEDMYVYIYIHIRVYVYICNKKIQRFKIFFQVRTVIVGIWLVSRRYGVYREVRFSSTAIAEQFC